MPIYRTIAKGLAAGLVGAAALITANAANAAEPVSVAFGDVIDVESLPAVVALERAKERGVDYKLTSFSGEDLAIQAVIGGQADMGIATPYAVMQKVKVLRNIFQQEGLAFYAVVSNKYKTWKDLDGQPITYNSRGSSTEAYGDYLAEQNGIKFGQVNYLAGSDHRAIALLNGTIDAAIIDPANKNLVLKKAPDKFHVLKGSETNFTNEAIFAKKEWLDSHKKEVAVITEEFLKLYRQMQDDPGIIEKDREKYGLLSDQPKEGVTEFIKEGLKAGLWSPVGASSEIARSDLGFYVTGGQLKGPADKLKVDDFWDFDPIKAAKKKLQ